MSTLRLAIRHEFRMAAANKAFIILTILGPFIILAVTVLPTLLVRTPGSATDARPIAIVGAEAALREGLTRQIHGMGIQVQPERIETDPLAALAAVKQEVLDGKLQGALALEPGWPGSGTGLWYSRTGSDAALFGALEAMLAALARDNRIAASGLDPATVARILEAPGFEVIKLQGGGKEERASEGAFMQLLFTVLSFVMLLYMTVMLYGQIIGRSVVTEKTSKTVEIMLSSMSTRDLMFGKILGIGLAGLVQYGVWISMATLLKQLVAPILGLEIPAALSAGNLLWLVVFFVLGFFLYASAYAALGAASEDEQHLGQLAWPLLAFLIVPFVMISSFISNPDSSLAVALSLFPRTSPLVMFVRVLVSAPPAGELALCLTLLILAVAATAFLAARVFRIGILLTGKRATMREVIRWVRVK